MPWGKVDDKLHSSQKWLATPLRARGLWAGAVSWCMDQLTDGAIPEHVVRALGGTRKDAADLVRTGLWEEAETGWIFHDWLEYQPSREQILAERAAAAARQKKARDRAKQKRDQAEHDAVTGQSRRDSHRDYTRESRSPRPDPTHIDRDMGSNGHQSEDHDTTPQLETTIPSHVIPASWGPTTRHKAYAMEHKLNLDREIEKFRGHARATRKTRIDWDAEFDGWLAKSAEMTEDRAEPPRPGASVWDNDYTGMGQR